MASSMKPPTGGEGSRCTTVEPARKGETGSSHEPTEFGDEGAQSMERSSASSLRQAVSTSLWHADAVSASLRAWAPIWICR